MRWALGSTGRVATLVVLVLMSSQHLAAALFLEVPPWRDFRRDLVVLQTLLGRDYAVAVGTPSLVGENAIFPLTLVQKRGASLRIELDWLVTHEERLILRFRDSGEWVPAAKKVLRPDGRLDMVRAPFPIGHFEEAFMSGMFLPSCDEVDVPDLSCAQDGVARLEVIRSWNCGVAVYFTAHEIYHAFDYYYLQNRSACVLGHPDVDGRMRVFLRPVVQRIWASHPTRIQTPQARNGREAAAVLRRMREIDFELEEDSHPERARARKGNKRRA